MKKTPLMQRKYLLQTVLFLLLMAGGFMILNSSTSDKAESNTVCSESMEECNKKATDRPASGDMIWESLSRQFISISSDMGR